MGWISSDAAKFRRTSGGLNDRSKNVKQDLSLVRKGNLDHNTLS